MHGGIDREAAHDAAVSDATALVARFCEAHPIYGDAV